MFRFEEMGVPVNMYRVYLEDKHICDAIKIEDGWLALDQKYTVVFAKEKEDAVKKFIQRFDDQDNRMPSPPRIIRRL